MASDRYDGVWVDEIDGPERLERAKKRRAEQLKRWEVRETRTDDESTAKRKRKRTLNFTSNIVMLEAAARNDLKEVASLLESGVSPDLANEDGLTALHQSCIDGCDEMVKYLVEHKANVNACDNERWTPLHAAAACGHMSIIQYLIKNGGNILALNLDGNLPAGVVEDNEEVEELLDKEMLKLGYDEAAIEELRLNEGKQLLNDLKDSVENGRSLDIQDENGATAFHVAAANGWTNVIDFLMEHEADFEIADEDGWQPIHAAAAWGHDTVLEVLVASGADLDSKTNDSKTPLDLTEEDEIIELIEELKTKQVKYPRKGKGVRRKRSNTSNSSIKRTSIHEKSVLSHADTKAEGAELYMQLQNAENASSPVTEESANIPKTVDGKSNTSREENNSSGYVSETSNNAQTEEKHELKTSEITVNIDDKNKHNKENADVSSDENKENFHVEKDENKTGKQSPVPKPPRLGTLTTARLDPQAYINIEIEPTDTKTSGTTKNESNDKADVKQDLAKNEKADPETTIENSRPKTELKTSTQENAHQNTNQHKTHSVEHANNENNTNELETRTTSTLPKLAPTDKRKAPEPPDGATKKVSGKSSKKDPGAQKVPVVKNDARSSKAASNTAVSASKDQLPASKSSGHGFSFHRKTCCCLM